MNASIARHLVLEQRIDHAVPGRLHLGLECLGGDQHVEVCLARGRTLHGLVMRVKVRVVADLEARGGQFGGDLFAPVQPDIGARRHGGGRTRDRIRSSTGVLLEAMLDRVRLVKRGKPRGTRRSIWGWRAGKPLLALAVSG